MTESEWNECQNAIAMLEIIFERQGIRSDSTQHKMGYRLNSGSVASDSTFETELHRFYLACCRAIWPLLLDGETRKGVEIAEQWLEGIASDSDLNECDYHVEGAAFGIDYKCSPEELQSWISVVDAIPRHELESMLHSHHVDQRDSYVLLKSAAYFAHFAIIYPAITPKGLPPHGYHQFLSPQLLRQHVRYTPQQSDQPKRH